MEDSGIDSGDKASFNRHGESNRIAPSYNITESDEDYSSNNNLDVMFKGSDANAISIVEVASSLHTGYAYDEENNPITADKPKNHRSPLSVRTSATFSTCKTLQRKLELKVQRVKRSYSQRNNDESSKTSAKSPSLMPINRLKIPGQQEILPLVKYKSGHSDDDDDDEQYDDDEISFYPILKTGIKHELSDTFSLQEMTIMGTDDDPTGNEDDDDDSQTLEFLSPKLAGRTFSMMESFVKCFCCANKI